MRDLNPPDPSDVSRIANHTPSGSPMASRLHLASLLTNVPATTLQRADLLRWNYILRI